MLRRPAALSNAERQRQFRERNPGYYARIQATKRASEKRARAQHRAQLLAEHAATLEATTSDAAPLTAVAETPPPTVEVVADSADVLLRIRPSTPDAVAA